MNENEAFDSLDAQTALLTSLQTSLRRDRTERKRSFRIMLLALIFATIFGMADGAALWYVVKVRDQQQSIAKVARSNAKITKANLELAKTLVAKVQTIQELASVIDPASPRGQASAKAAIESRLNYLVEQDCRVRRALAGLSEPKRGDVCVLP